MQLTPEQLEKAAQAAYESCYKQRVWEDAHILSRNEWFDAVTAAFAAVEPPQVDVPGDLVERMLDACQRGAEDSWRSYCDEDRKTFKEAMADSLRVALEDPRALGDVTYEEREIHRDQSGFIPAVIDTFIASRRARLLVPQETSEQLAVKEILEKYGVWHGDGLRKAQTDLVGLIAKLKEEGTVSHAGGEEA